MILIDILEKIFSYILDLAKYPISNSASWRVLVGLQLLWGGYFTVGYYVCMVILRELDLGYSLFGTKVYILITLIVGISSTGHYRQGKCTLIFS